MFKLYFASMNIRIHFVYIRYVEEQIVGPDQAKLLTDDTFTQTHLAMTVQSLHQYHTKMFAGLHFLHHLGLQLPRFPLGKQFRELYSVCLTSNHVCECDGYKETLALLRMMSMDDLCPLLEGKIFKRGIRRQISRKSVHHHNLPCIVT